VKIARLVFLACISLAVHVAGEDTNVNLPHPVIVTQPQRDWEVVRSVSNSPYPGTIEFVLIPEQKRRDLAYYQEIVTVVCGTRDTCMVDFWTDRAHIPTSNWIPGTDLRVMTARYERSPSYKSPVLKLACWLYPSKEVGESANCFYMPGATMRWDKSEPATKKTSDVATQNVAMAVVIAIAVLGLILIVIGFIALWFCFRVAASAERPKNWRRLLAGALICGLLLAPASWVGTYFLGYPLSSSQGLTGRVVGIPFMAAWFDSEGRDYVGPTTLPAVLANAVFWFLVPQIALAAYAWGSRRRLSAAHGTV
jgi:hypothetical protein